MKKIVKRSGEILTVEEALALCKQIKAKTGDPYVEHTSVYGYPTADMAKRANFAAVCETYENYVFAFAGTINIPFEGYKVHVIASKIRPCDLEAQFHNYLVLE